MNTARSGLRDFGTAGQGLRPPRTARSPDAKSLGNGREQQFARRPPTLPRGHRPAAAAGAQPLGSEGS